MKTTDLGINKDLKPLVRLARRAGWEVSVTGGNHVRWRAPSGWSTTTSLSGSQGGVRIAKRAILRQLESG